MSQIKYSVDMVFCNLVTSTLMDEGTETQRYKTTFWKTGISCRHVSESFPEDTDVMMVEGGFQSGLGEAGASGCVRFQMWRNLGLQPS